MVLSLLLTILVMVTDRVIYRLWSPPSAAIHDAVPSIMAAAPSIVPLAAVEPYAQGQTAPVGPVDNPAVTGDLASGQAAPTGLAHDLAPVASGLGIAASAEERGSIRLINAPLPALHARLVTAKSPRLAPALKLTLHTSLTLLLHICFCLGISPTGASVLPVWACDRVVCDGTPSPPGEPICVRSVAGLTLYLLCALYLLLSARQLRHGMPLIPTEHPLTGSPRLSRYYLHLLGLSFPFLWEMRTTLDWSVSATSLSLFEWIKLEDIYVGLVSVRATMTTKLAHPFGARRPFSTKLGTGGTLIAVVLVLILGPLFFFSSGNPITQPNRVMSAQVRLTLRTPSGLFPLGTISRFNNDLERSISPDDSIISGECSAKQLQTKDNSGCGYAYLLPLEANVDYQRLVFAEASDLLWTISPQALEQLSSTLSQHQLEVHLEATVEWTREVAVGGSTVVRLSNAVLLSEYQREQMLQVSQVVNWQVSAMVLRRPPHAVLCRLPPNTSLSLSLSLCLLLAGDKCISCIQRRLDFFDISFCQIRALTFSRLTASSSTWGLSSHGMAYDAGPIGRLAGIRVAATFFGLRRLHD
mmetsp:Transcript_27676/g.84449  ORF Transcript_27676/g.84449 Transcript_27676/m.84449 type:complete len:584 (-) Transcript_27676:579-2330(-)